jgi:hypothetical protein
MAQCLPSSSHTFSQLVQEHMAASGVVNGEGTSLIQTVQGNYKGYRKKEVLQAREAWKVQAMLGNPSKKDFKGMVSSNIIPTCLITRGNATNAQNICSPGLASIHGKTVHQTPTPVVGDYVAIPCKLVEANAAVTLAAKVFFVDGTMFLMTVSRNIRFIMAEHVPVQIAKSLCQHLERVLLVY